MKRTERGLEPIRLAPRRDDDGAIVDVELDTAIVLDTKILICCNSGGGKSYALRSIIEQVLEQGQCFIVDKEGEFKTLREKYDAVLVGPDGELPASPKTAKELAASLAKAGCSAILDISDLEPDQQCAFVAEFFDGLFNLPKAQWRPRFIFLDEAQEFAPQVDVSAAQAVSLRAVVRVAALGRKRGLCLIPASQRIAKVSKNLTAECNNRLIGRFAEDTDLRRAVDLLGFGKGKWQLLQRAKPGEFYAYGPAFNFDGVQLVRTGVVHTTHPRPGARHRIATPAPSSAIAEIVAELRARALAIAAEESANLEPSAEPAVAGDAGLRAQLQSLELQLAQREAEIAEQRDVAPDELEDAYRRGMTAVVRAARELLEDRFRLLHDAFSSLLHEEKAAILAQDLFTSPDHGFCRIREDATAGHAARPSDLVVDKVERVDWGALTPLPGPRLYADAHASAATPHPKNGTPAPASAPARAPAADGGARDRMLVALLQHPGPVPKRRVALLAHVRLGGSSWRGGLAALRKDELVADADVDEVVATTAARKAYAGKVPRLPTGRELLAYWQSYLKNSAAARMFAVVAENPRGVQKKAIESRTGITLGGSSWRGGLATLRTLGLIVDLHVDVIALSPHLF